MLSENTGMSWGRRDILELPVSFKITEENKAAFNFTHRLCTISI